MEKERIIDLMLETKVIPLFYESNTDIACKLIDACYNGGARVIEFTDRGEEAEEVFRELITYCKNHYPTLALGVGSIATVDQANRFIDMGAHFLISPFLDKEVAQACSKRNVLWMGGCATLTEMHTADSWGVPIMKAFPGNILGPSFIKAAKAPCPWLNIMPTGGVEPEEENLKAWFGAGACCVGMGSKIFIKNEQGEFDYAQITALLSKSIKIAQEVAK